MTAPPIPAATLVLVREGAGSPEVLMVQRTAAMAFAPGAWVFPGGRVDPGDQVMADRLGLAEDGAARIAAVRETLEETGLGVAIEPMDEQAQTAARAALLDGVAISEALARHRLVIHPDRLVAFARWIPDLPQTRIFDTRFFLAHHRDAAGTIDHMTDEIADHRWTTPGAMLGAADRDEAHIIFPTRRNLERLARFATFAEMVADARAHAVEPITPVLQQRGGEAWLCIPEDRGYPVTAERMATVRRGSPRLGEGAGLP